jgi:hypothetical protein
MKTSMKKKAHHWLLGLVCFGLTTAMFECIFVADSSLTQWRPLRGGHCLSFSEAPKLAQPELTLLHSDEKAIEIVTELPGCMAQDIKVEGKVYTRLYGEGYGYPTGLGLPDLPVLRRNVEIPFGAKVALEVADAEYTDYALKNLGLHPIYPMQPPVPKIPGSMQNRAFVIDHDFYRRGSLYPKEPVALGKEYIVRGHRIQPVEVWPVAYEPSKGTLRLFRKITFRLRLTGSDMIRTRALAERYASPVFESRLARQVLNYNQTRPLGRRGPMRDGQGVGYLIITRDDCYDPMLPFVNLKESQGFTVTMTSLSEICSDCISYDIKDYIKNAYDHREIPPSYLLLVGDTDDIPPWHSDECHHLLGTVVTDLYYACMDTAGLTVADQVNDAPTGKSRGCGTSRRSLFQSFTPSASILAAVDLRLRAGGRFPGTGYDTTIRIKSGTPEGPVLRNATATTFVPGPQVPGAQLAVCFEFSAQIPVTPGDTYVIEWISPPEGGPILSWLFAEDGSYPGGTAFGCTKRAIPDGDFIFTTYKAGDWHPDMGLGRFPVNSVQEATNMVDKYLAYANLTGQEEWLKKVAFIATCDDHMWPSVEDAHDYVIDNYTEPQGYTGTFPNNPQRGGDKLYCVTEGARREDVVNCLNNGSWMVIYQGHGGWRDWEGLYYDDDVRNVSEGVFPFVASFACSTGYFYCPYGECPVNECLGETWVLQENKGALAFWGSSSGTTWNRDIVLQNGMVDSLFGRFPFVDPKASPDLQQITQDALVAFGRQFGELEERVHREMYNLLGDPATKLSFRVKWAFPTEDWVSSSPVIGADGTIYVGSWDNNLYAIGSSSRGLAIPPWPMFHHNVRHTGRAAQADFPPPGAGEGGGGAGGCFIATAAYASPVVNVNGVRHK